MPPRLIQQQLIDKINHRDKNGRDYKLWRDYVSKLPITDAGIGDCIEVSYHPRNVRKYAHEEGLNIVIRHRGDMYRIWLVR